MAGLSPIVVGITGTIAALLLPLEPAAAAGKRFSDWVTLHNARHGFSIAYPLDIFTEKAEPASDEGRVFESPDGKARLLVGAFENASETNIKDYRDFVIEQNYPGAKIDYAPVKDRWFILSGERDGTMFYERVSFTCGGRLINSWAMLYPVAERKLYDRVVEAVSRTYSAGAGPDGSCNYGQTSATEPRDDPPARQDR